MSGEQAAETHPAQKWLDDEEVRGRGTGYQRPLLGVGVDFCERACERVRVAGPVGAGVIRAVLAGTGDG